MTYEVSFQGTYDLQRLMPSLYFVQPMLFNKQQINYPFMLYFVLCVSVFNLQKFPIFIALYSLLCYIIYSLLYIHYSVTSHYFT